VSDKPLDRNEIAVPSIKAVAIAAALHEHAIAHKDCSHECVSRIIDSHVWPLIALHKKRKRRLIDAIRLIEDRWIAFCDGDDDVGKELDLAIRAAGMLGTQLTGQDEGQGQPEVLFPN